MRSTTIRLADKDYLIQQLPMRLNREWRKKFEVPIEQLLAATKAAGSLASKEYETTADLLKDVGAVLLLHSDSIVRVLISLVDLISDAVFSYSPELQTERKAIEEKAFDEEIVKAFLEVAKLAYPFSGVFEAMTKLGQATQATEQNSSSQSTDASMTSSKN